ncbi:MAG: hypothetical protein WBX38_22450 [Candidatus Sulfotelmatobacter sp.]
MLKRSLDTLAAAVILCGAWLLLPRTATPQQGSPNAFIVSPMTVRVASDFTTTSTSLTTITGLSWSLPSIPAAQAYSFHCAGLYSQAATTSIDTFGFQVTATPNNWTVFGTANSTNAGFKMGATDGSTTDQTGTAATNVVSNTPTAGQTLPWTMYGTVENKANTAATVNIMVKIAGTSTLTVYRGSYCAITP